MADNARAKRLADLIREVVAQKLQRGIKDPRLGSHVTIICAGPAPSARRPVHASINGLRRSSRVEGHSVTAECSCPSPFAAQ